MEDELFFDGIKYVSSIRGAKLVGYTKDYVGQLCRAGKIEARFIGRTWYVSEDGIRRHKLGVHYTRHLPMDKRGDAFVNGISTPRDVARTRAERGEHVPIRSLGKESRSAGVRESSSMSAAIAERHADDLKNRQYKTLSQSDVRFEQGEPLYFEDDRPVLPEPHKVTRFEGAPIVARSAQPRERAAAVVGSPVAVRSVTVRTSAPVRGHRSGPSVDGVSPQRERSTEGRRPVTRPLETPRDRLPRRSDRTSPSLEYSPPSSKVFPLLGALLVVILSVLAWVVALIFGMEMPALP